MIVFDVRIMESVATCKDDDDYSMPSVYKAACRICGSRGKLYILHTRSLGHVQN